MASSVAVDGRRFGSNFGNFPCFLQTLLDAAGLPHRPLRPNIGEAELDDRFANGLKMICLIPISFIFYLHYLDYFDALSLCQRCCLLDYGHNGYGIV
jgi:hypothetical protein